MQHHGTEARALVWAHNTRIGDARFTDMVEGGMVNLGHLVRTQQHDVPARSQADVPETYPSGV